MSDALSEIARDQERNSAFQQYLLALCRWCEAGFSPEMRTEVIKAAEDTDLVRGGYWGSSTNLLARIEKRLDLLAAGDLKQWGRLIQASDDEWTHDIRQRVLAASPFKDRAVGLIAYGHGFVRFHSDGFEALLSKAIQKKGGTTFKGETHLIVMPQDIFDHIEVVTLQERR